MIDRGRQVASQKLQGPRANAKAGEGGDQRIVERLAFGQPHQRATRARRNGDCDAISAW
jgi:hypothetical protein